MTGICLNIQPPPPRGSSGSTDDDFDNSALDSLPASEVTDLRNPIPAPQSWLIPIRFASRAAVMMNEYPFLRKPAQKRSYWTSKEKFDENIRV